MQKLLKTVPIFKKLNDSELDKLFEIAEPAGFEKEDVLITENEHSDTLYIIVEGYARVATVKDGEEEPVSLLRQGDSIGEVTFIDDAMPSASVIAQEKLKVLAFPHDRLKKFMEDEPVIASKILWALASTLCRKIRETTNSLSLARELI